MSIKIIQLGRVSYQVAYEQQMQLIKSLHTTTPQDDICLVLEHDPVFTLGRNGTPDNVAVSETFLRKRGIKLIKIERGGEVTYHGPGQIVCYPLINLRKNHLGVAEYVYLLERIMLNVVSRFGIVANRDSRNHGIWKEDQKIGSIGIAVRHGITYHGMALNVNLDLEPFSWVNPCGLKGIQMSSMEKELEHSIIFKKVENAMIEEISHTFKDCTGEKHPRQKKRLAKPQWLRRSLPSGSGYEKTRRLVRVNGLSTVCQEARCPNQFECFGKGTATFMLMGENCTRNCSFCSVGNSAVKPLNPFEPKQIAAAIKNMKLSYAVLTSVTRDDLPDGGAAHFGLTIDAIKKTCPETLVEVLISDLQGDGDALEVICKHGPSVINHNIETVSRLYPAVRPQAIYTRSLELLMRVKKYHPQIVTKSGLMVGLGESREELVETMSDIRKTGCDLLTLGQYLQPTKDNLEVSRYVPPVEFEDIKETALKMGFSGVSAGPHVRSSYQAGDLYQLAV